jgi:hypothetical protein
MRMLIAFQVRLAPAARHFYKFVHILTQFFRSGMQHLL